jgi:hypothetical protein
LSQRLSLVSSRRRVLSICVSVLATFGIGACAAPATRGTAAPGPADLAALSRPDAMWLERVSFGLDSGTVAEFRRLGRERYLEEQLTATGEALPAPIAAQIHALQTPPLDAAQILQSLQQRRQAANAMAEGPDKEQARKALNDDGNRLAYQAVRLELLPAIY